MKARTFFIRALILLLGIFSTVVAQEITKDKNPKLKLPDLFIDHSEYDHVKPRVRFLVENKGNGASAPCTLKLVAVKAKSFMLIETVEYTHALPALAAGERYANIFPLPKTENGIATVPQTMTVDSMNVVKELNEKNNEWSFVSEPVTRQMAELRDMMPSRSLPARRIRLSAHRRSAPDADIITCPASVPAEVTSVPSGWQLSLGKFTLSFDSVDAVRQGGKSMVACNYGQHLGLGVVLFREMPPTFACTKTNNPRQVRCSSIIKPPKK